MHYHLRTLALCVTIGLAGYFIGTSVIKARFGMDIQGMGTPGRISQFVTSDTIADSPIREANGNIAVGANARPQFKALVNDGRLGVNANTTGGLGALVVSQNGSGPIATLRSGTETEVIVDAVTRKVDEYSPRK